ncbi:MAG: hypothetical protein OEW24_10160 [Chloroflexota bacterium]|nr:hypothetical protein [Chloroflexota bacterium]
MSDEEPIWVLFKVPTPTPIAGQTARDLFEKRVTWISDEMRESARSHGLRFHRCWHAANGSAFYAIACWQTREGANAFYTQWDIGDEEGEEAVRLEGNLGLLPLG